MDKEFSLLLKVIGLTTNQVKIYLSVLELGLSSVTDISKYTLITRSQVYIDTAILLENNFLEIAVRKPKKFLAINPRDIQRIVTRQILQLNKLNDLLPKIGSLYDKPVEKDKDVIVFYEGVAKLKTAMNL